jgi:hypothetical protein
VFPDKVMFFISELAFPPPEGLSYVIVPL